MEEFNGQATHYGPAIVTVFRGLTQAKNAEGPAEAIGRSTFHTEPALSNQGITPAFQTISTALAHRNTSQEVCVSRWNFPLGLF